jgi:hypothetical protein
LRLQGGERNYSLRLAIAGVVAIVGWVVWHYVISPRFKRLTQWLVQKWRYIVVVILLIVYVMLQCGQDRLYPHFRVNGTWTNPDWTRQNPVILPVLLPLNTWFGVHIEVRGTLVLVTVTVNNREREILNSGTLLEPPTSPTSYPMGSVGFRESANECAHFRNVRVKRLF